MAPQGKRGEAVASLKATLVQRFGEASREVVEAEVEGRLAASGGRLTREDIDAVERTVVAAARERRGGGLRRGVAHSRSAPNFGPPAPGAAGSAPAPPRPAGTPHPPPALGLGAAARQLPPGLRPASVASLAASAPAASSRRAPVAPAAPYLARHPVRLSEVKVPEPPYGKDLVDIDDAASDRSRVQVNPKFPVPLRPKLKPMDHWDLIVAFDAYKHRQEDNAFYNKGKADAHAKFKATLDGQMAEVQAIRDEEQEQKRRERDIMLAMMAENRMLQDAEHKRQEEKRDKMKKANDDMMQAISLRRQREQEKKQRDEQRMTEWLENERRRREEEERATAEECARKRAQAKEEMQAAIAEAQRRKKAREEEERTYVAEQQRGMDEKEAANRAAVKARMDQIERNCATLGAEIAERDAKAEKLLQEKIRKVQEESDRKAHEDAERRKSERERKVKDMLQKLNEQCQQRAEDGVADKVAGEKQAAIFREQYEAGVRKDQEDAEKRRKARAEQDAVLIEQMRAQLQVHPRNFLLTGAGQQTDVALNRMLYEQMHKEGFMTDLTGKILSHGPHRGKIDPFPSVGRYEGPIHPLELAVQETDVF